MYNKSVGVIRYKIICKCCRTYDNYNHCLPSQAPSPTIHTLSLARPGSRFMVSILLMYWSSVLIKFWSNLLKLLSWFKLLQSLSDKKKKEEVVPKPSQK